MNCEVLRCGNAAAEVLDISIPRSGPMSAGICVKHKAQIDQGARWVYEQEKGNEGRPGRLLMDRDLPPRALEESRARTLISPDGVTKVFSLVLEKPDGSREDVEFELPPRVADFVWRILSRGRGGTGSSASGS
jgi:hypothetical protein